jgi:hypothetical protein
MSAPFSALPVRGRVPVGPVASLFTPDSQVYFKMLVDGEAI